MNSPSPSFVYASNELDSLVGASNYYRGILDYFRPYLGKRILEIGAGIGTFSSLLLEAYPSHLLLFEPSRNLLPRLRDRFSLDRRVTVIEDSSFEGVAQSAEVDSIVLVNVLEHIQEDEATLRRLHSALTVGGAVLLFVPALPLLYGTLDKEFGHYRRYMKHDLVTKLQRAGFELAMVRYVNMLGVLTWYLAGKVLRKRTLKPQDVRLYDKLVVPWMSMLERHWDTPIGQSLICIGRK
jgi:SAM-dependent methyltransferase